MNIVDLLLVKFTRLLRGRREDALRILRQKRVYFDKKLVTDPDYWVDLERDRDEVVEFRVADDGYDWVVRLGT